MDPAGLRLPVRLRAVRGGSRNVPRDPGDGEAVSRRAAALLLLNFYGPLKESKNSDAVVTERYSIVPPSSLLPPPSSRAAIILRDCRHERRGAGSDVVEVRSALPPTALPVPPR